MWLLCAQPKFYFIVKISQGHIPKRRQQIQNMCRYEAEHDVFKNDVYLNPFVFQHSQLKLLCWCITLFLDALWYCFLSTLITLHQMSICWTIWQPWSTVSWPMQRSISHQKLLGDFQSQRLITLKIINHMLPNLLWVWSNIVLLHNQSIFHASRFYLYH